MKTLCAVLMTLCLAVPMGGAAENPISQLPKKYEIFLPKQPGAKAGWVVPPTRRKAPVVSAFDVDLAGEPWLGYGGRSLVNPLSLLTFMVDEKFQDMVYLDSGLLLVTNKKSVGYLVGALVKGSKRRLIRSVFKPVLELPAPDSRLFSGGSEGFYLVGQNPGSKNHDVYFIDFENKRGSVRKIVESAQSVNGVAGDGQTTWVAIGRAVARIERYQQDLQPVFAHPSEPILDLVSSPEGGLFYTTAGGVWFFHEGRQAPVMRGAHLKIRLRDNNLFVLLPQGQGMMKISGAQHYKSLEFREKTQ